MQPAKSLKLNYLHRATNVFTALSRRVAEQSIAMQLLVFYSKTLNLLAVKNVVKIFAELNLATRNYYKFACIMWSAISVSLTFSLCLSPSHSLLPALSQVAQLQLELQYLFAVETSPWLFSPTCT